MDGQEIFETGNLAQLARLTDRVGLTERQVLEHRARTAVTAVASLLVASSFGLPEIYWALVATFVITQSDLKNELELSNDLKMAAIVQ